MGNLCSVWHMAMAFRKVGCLREPAYIYNPKVNIGWKPVKAIIQRKYTFTKTNTNPNPSMITW